MEMKEHEKIGAFVRRTLPTVVENGLTDKDLNVLCSESLSKQVFDMYFPVLLKVDESISERENRLVDGYGRYYAKPILKIDGTRYMISNDWYERNSSFYTSWLNKRKR